MRVLAADLDEFISDLLDRPIHTENFTATFAQTAPDQGILLFQHTQSGREASLCWEACIEQNEVIGVLRYNHRFVLLRAGSDRFRDLVAQMFPVF